MLKIYYATMPSVKPPHIVLFVNDVELLHFSYKRYLENQIRKSYAFEGTPIKIDIRKAIAEPPPGQGLAVVSDRSPVGLSTTTQPMPAPANQPSVAASQSTALMASRAPIPLLFGLLPPEQSPLLSHTLKAYF